MSNGKLTAILLNLHQNPRSGILRIERRQEKKQLVLTEGTLSFAEGNAPGDNLAKIMVEQRLLPPLKLREVVFEMKKGRTSEEALLALPGVKAQDVAKGVAEQALSIMASLWRWDDYAVNFYPGEKLIARKVKMGLPLPDAIIFSARRAVSRRLYIAPNGFLEGRYTTSGSFLSGGAAEIPFNDTESSVLVSLQKPLNTVDLMTRVAARTGNPEEAILTLDAIGLIRFQAPGDILMDASDADAMLRLLDDMLYRISTATHYELLSVPRNVGQEELQDAYHKLARLLHPDRFQSKEFASDIPQKAQKAFAAVNEAYFTLKDPIMREAYDDQLANAQSPGGNISEDEKMADTFFQNGRAFIAKREFEKAVEQLKGCVWLNPGNAQYNLYLGIAEAGVGKTRRDAEKHFLRAIELDDDSAQARLELAKLYMAANLPRKAEPYLHEVLERDPVNQQAQKLLAKIA